MGNVALTIVNFLPPLLFVTFRTEFGLSAGAIGYLTVINFGIQTLTDLFAAKYIDRIGYRRGACGASIMCAGGLMAMALLPYIFPNAYAGLIVASIWMGIGGGLTEVLASPIVEAIPGGNKVANMSLLHAFFGWGFAIVVFLSSIYFVFFGIANWRILLFIWAILPAVNCVLFLNVPINTLEIREEHATFRRLFGSRIFILLLLMMISAGASEMAVGQWVSYFAEMGLGISKTTGDLAGACGFGALTGVGRTLFSRYGNDDNLRVFLIWSGLLCVVCYLLIVFSPSPLISLISCTVCGLAVSVMWPGVFSLSALSYKEGGAAMFAFLALAGDIGCGAGPGLVGAISGMVEASGASFLSGLTQGVNISELALKTGFLAAIIFPAALTLGVLRTRRRSAGQ
jgi:MFS family permease